MQQKGLFASALAGLDPRTIRDTVRPEQPEAVATGPANGEIIAALLGNTGIFPDPRPIQQLT